RPGPEIQAGRRNSMPYRCSKCKKETNGKVKCHLCGHTDFNGFAPWTGPEETPTTPPPPRQVPVTTPTVRPPTPTSTVGTKPGTIPIRDQSPGRGMTPPISPPRVEPTTGGSTRVNLETLV